MSIIIKGAKVPTICQECPCFANMRVDVCETDEKVLFQRCGVTKQVLNIATDIDEIGDDWCTTHIPESCPIIEIPEHHGNLVDADALANDLDADVRDIYNMFDVSFFDDGDFKTYRDYASTQQNAANWLRSNKNRVILEAE